MAAKTGGYGSGRACPLGPGISDINLFRYCQGVIDLDAEIPDRAFDLGMPEQELDGPEISRPPIDQGSFCASKRMRPKEPRVIERFQRGCSPRTRPATSPIVNQDRHLMIKVGARQHHKSACQFRRLSTGHQIARRRGNLAMAFILRKPRTPCQITNFNLSGSRGALHAYGEL
jgi:hypothetical protein